MVTSCRIGECIFEHDRHIFERVSPLKSVRVIPVTYVKTGQTSMLKDSFFGCLTMNVRTHTRLAYPPRSVMAVGFPSLWLPSTATLLPCGSLPRSDHLTPPTDHHVQAHSPRVAPEHVFPEPATAARSRIHRVQLSLPAHTPCALSTRTAAVHAPSVQPPSRGTGYPPCLSIGISCLTLVASHCSVRVMSKFMHVLHS